MDLAAGPSADLVSALRGEPALWTGRPDAGVWFGRGDLFLVPVTVL